jgi:hypothetical protein
MGEGKGENESPKMRIRGIEEGEEMGIAKPIAR